LPVEQVSWLNAQEFCKKLSQKTGKNYSLPSESQWEYACRAGTTTPFAFGDTITTDTANYNGKAPNGIHRQMTTSVDTFPPNAFGVFDMHGNVWEWCADTWHNSYAGAPTDGSSWISGNDNDSQTFRLLRGGSWDSYPYDCRSADRYRRSADSRSYYIGFRVVCAQDL
jgi:formylglycine-generating enzyme required for sulfatase activity